MDLKVCFILHPLVRKTPELIHYNDLLLEPIKKISYKLFVAKKRKWWNGDYKYVTPGIDSVETFKKNN